MKYRYDPMGDIAPPQEARRPAPPDAQALEALQSQQQAQMARWTAGHISGSEQKQLVLTFFLLAMAVSLFAGSMADSLETPAATFSYELAALFALPAAWGMAAAGVRLYVIAYTGLFLAGLGGSAIWLSGDQAPLFWVSAILFGNTLTTLSLGSLFLRVFSVEDIPGVCALGAVLSVLTLAVFAILPWMLGGAAHTLAALAVVGGLVGLHRKMSSESNCYAPVTHSRQTNPRPPGPARAALYFLPLLQTLLCFIPGVALYDLFLHSLSGDSGGLAFFGLLLLGFLLTAYALKRIGAAGCLLAGYAVQAGLCLCAVFYSPELARQLAPAALPLVPATTIAGWIKLKRSVSKEAILPALCAGTAISALAMTGLYLLFTWPPLAAAMTDILKPASFHWEAPLLEQSAAFAGLYIMASVPPLLLALWTAFLPDAPDAQDMPPDRANP